MNHLPHEIETATIHRMAIPITTFTGTMTAAELYQWRLLLGTTIRVPCVNSVRRSSIPRDIAPRCKGDAAQSLTTQLPGRHERAYELCAGCLKAIRAWIETDSDRRYTIDELPPHPMSQKEIAELTGYSLNTWSRWEQGAIVSNPVIVRRALVQVASERGIVIKNYPARTIKQRVEALQRAALAVAA